jgi:excisionase family DNA binding protein
MTAQRDTEARLLNVGDAAAYVGVSASSLRNWANQGLLPVYRTPGGQRRFTREDLDGFMHSMREQPLAGRRALHAIAG